MVTGNVVLPVSAEAVMVPPAPTFTVATENIPVPVVPGIFVMPSLLIVAAKATMSGVEVDEAENKSVFTPVMVLAIFAFKPW